MDLTLKAAAALTGKSERQLRYLVQQGKLAATKVDGEWRFKREDLPVNPGQAEAAGARDERLRDVVQQVLGLDEPPPEKKRYSVRDMRAFTRGQQLYHELAQQLGPDHELVATLRRLLGLLARGCHAFHARDKIRVYSEAREEACELLTGLLLHQPVEPLTPLADRVEQELIPAIGGLIRRGERRNS